MIRPWKECNSYGKLLIFCCIINCILAVELAVSGHWLGVFSITSAAFCGIGTYSKKCTKVSVTNDNDG
tara:strand:- start:13698 stop:13901 length:204 start_codon:yes stop_codon:yes gene_type:complete